MKNNLTIVIISKNESEVIANALKSTQGFADEVIVIDSLSIDNTVAIAEKFGAIVKKHAFKDFAEQRSIALSYIKTKWVFYMDADEELTEGFKKEVEHILKNREENSTIGGYFINRKTYYYGHDWHMTDSVQRLFVTQNLIGWYGKVHETPKITGEFGHILSPVLHFTHRNLSQMLQKTNEWSEYEAKLRFQVQHPKMEAWRFFRVMGSEFLRSYVKDKGYKNGTYGLIEAIYQAFSIFITYAKLWEMQNKQAKK